MGKGTKLTCNTDDLSMAGGIANSELAAVVSNAGGLETLGAEGKYP
ncbi:hypothetical protein [Kroppenstedtia guangzhouensis]|nr:hypothetical protein [Kroppenstedtia guangzhouensis]